MMRKTVVLLMAVALALLVSSGVASAAKISCPNRADGSCVGTKKVDTLTGSGTNEILRAGAGNDVLRGMAGDDALLGMAGSDRSVGGIGDDQYAFNEAWGADTIVDTQDAVDFSGGNAILFDLGNAISFGPRANTGAITVRLNPGAGPEVRRGANTVEWSGTPISTVVVFGANGGDTITGSDAANLIQPAAGGNTVSSAGGDDWIVAVDGSPAADTIDCGEGTDTVFFDQGVDQIAANCEGQNPPPQ